MKFSFKKKGEGGNTEAKPSKRKSRSGGNGLASMKSFLADHGEKLAFGVIVAVSVYIIYSGFSRDGLKAEPDDVKSAITRATTVMNAETWAQVRENRQPEPDAFKEQATEDTIDISAADFQMPMPLHPVLQAQRERRKDPELVAPLELEVRAGYGPLSVNAAAGGGGISDLIRGPQQETRALPDKYRNRKGQSSGGENVESRFFVAITGLVPIQQQQELFKAALANAIEYQIERDTPRYLAVDLERREIQPDGQAGEWVSLNAPRETVVEPKRWDGRNDERASSDHIIGSLVMPLPPLLFRDISDWALHSKIPEAVDDSIGIVRDDVSDAAPENEEFDLWDGAGPGDDGQPDDGSVDDRTNANQDYAAADDQLKVEFALLRFFDFKVEPGRDYEYRARVFLEDPNNPRTYQRPTSSACETTVVVRRQANPKKHLVESPWSEVSSRVKVPSGRSVFAGAVEAPTMVKVNSRVVLPRKATDEPEATVMAVTWNAKEAMDVSSAIQVRRGSVVNRKLIDIEAVDPAKSRIRWLRGYSFATNSLVVDIAGGDLLERRGREEVRAPGMVLVMDERGNITFHSELQDFDQFDYYTIPPDDDAQTFTDTDNDKSQDENRRTERNRSNRRRDRPGEEAAGASEVRNRRGR